MDSKAIKGYLVGYDGDERYRIYVPEKNQVIVSRDVYFQEKTQVCDDIKPSCDQGGDFVSLPFKDVQQPLVKPVEDEVDKNEVPVEEQLEDTIRDISGDDDDEYETGADTDFEEKVEKTIQEDVYEAKMILDIDALIEAAYSLSHGSSFQIGFLANLK